MPSGSVQGHYLLDTKEYDAQGRVAHEGEAKMYVTCENLSRSSTWTSLAGHSSRGLVPPPFPSALAAWAASTVTTLNRLLPAENVAPYRLVGRGAADRTRPPSDAEAAGNVAVDLITPAGGRRGDAQSNAAQGVVAPRRVVRRVKVPGSPKTTPIKEVQAALWADPISAACLRGGVLIEDEVLVA